MKILTVLGARPQFIKAASISRAITKHDNINEIIVHTGQHYDANMSDVFFEELEIPAPDHQLNIGSRSHAKQTAMMLTGLEEIMQAENPDWILVYGDTNSTLAVALAAAKLHIPIAHVEAGLRSYNRKMPEEINRLVADQLSTLLFAPTEQAVKNLQQEGYSSKQIINAGDVMYDCALYYSKRAEEQSTILSTHGLTPKKYILATVHRAENTDDPERLKNIINALEQINKDIPVVLPLHPRTAHALKAINVSEPNLHLIDPASYIDMLTLEKNSKLIITDSGGVQKEAFFHRVPCVTLRDETEWVETVELGCNYLAPPQHVSKILEAFNQALNTKMIPETFPYGEGNSAEKIVGLMKDRTKTL